MYVCECVCYEVHMCDVSMCTCGYMHPCKHRGQMMMLDVLLNCSLPYSLETESFLEPGACLALRKPQ